MNRLLKRTSGRWGKKGLSLLLILLLLFSLLPAGAFAEEGAGVPIIEKQGTEEEEGPAGKMSEEEPADPFSIAGHPQNVRVTAGEEAVFSVEAEGGSGEFAYQWESSADAGEVWEEIAGATEGEYAIEAVTAEMDGLQLRCLVADEDKSSVTSDAATLTVSVGEEEEEKPVEAYILVAAKDITVLTETEEGMVLAESVEAGNTYTVRVTLANNGEEEAAELKVVLYAALEDEEPVLLDTQAIDNFAAGDEALLDFAWTPEETGDYTLTAVVIAGGEEIDGAELAVSVAGIVPILPRMMELTGMDGTNVKIRLNASSEEISFVDIENTRSFTSYLAAVPEGTTTVDILFPEGATPFDPCYGDYDIVPANTWTTISLDKYRYFSDYPGDLLDCFPSLDPSFKYHALDINDEILYVIQVGTAISEESTKVWFYCENPQSVQYGIIGATSYSIEERNIIAPMRQVEVTSSDVTRINGLIHTNISSSLDPSGVTAAHVLIKALEEMGKDPWTYVSWNADGTIASINGLSAAGVYQTPISGTSSYYALSSLMCIVGDNAISTANLTEASVADGQVLRIAKYARGGTAANTTEANLFAGNIGVTRYTDNNVYFEIPAEANGSFTVEAKLNKYNSTTLFTNFNSPYIDIYRLKDDGSTEKLSSAPPFELLSAVTTGTGTGEITIKSTDAISLGTYYIRLSNRLAVTAIYISLSPSDYLVVKATEGSTTDKTALQAALAADPATDHYISSDRWNGKEYTGAGGSFWTDYQTVKTSAQTIYNNAAATQKQIDDAADALTAAIANLIPKTNVNATALYEAIRSAGGKTQSAYSAASWSVLQAQVTLANAMLASLYDDSGNPVTPPNAAAYLGDGSIDEANSYQDEVNAQTAALIAAINALETRANEFQLVNAQMAYNAIPVLANKLFDTNRLNAANYAYGYEELATAREAALDFYNSHAAPVAGVGVNEAQAYVNAAVALWNACYSELIPEGTINVSLSVVDNYVIYNNDRVRTAGNFPALTLPGGATLNEALNQALGENYSSDWIMGRPDAKRGIGVYVNGVFQLSLTASSSNPPLSSDYGNIRLQNGDEITVALMAIPNYSNLSGSLTPYPLVDVGNSVKYRFFTQNMAKVSTLRVEEGQPFTLTANAQAALVSSYTGREYALPGAAVYVSGRLTEEEAATGAATINTETVTAVDGSFTHTLYEVGWYVLSAYDKSANGGLTNGPSVLVEVTASTGPAAVKIALKAALDTLYNAYEEAYYTPADWASINTLYTNGVSGIAGAATVGDAAAAQKIAFDGIRKIQDDTTADNTTKLSAFRGILDRLPDDLSKLGNSVRHLIEGYTLSAFDHREGLTEWYAALSDYQKGLLTGVEQAKYDNIVARYNAGLPDLAPYNLNLVVRADNSAAEAALADMTAYLQDSGAAERYYGSKFNTYLTALRFPDSYIHGSGYVAGIFDKETNAQTAAPDRLVTLMFDPGLAAYKLIDPDGVHGGPHPVSGSGWSIDGSGMTHSEYKNVYYELLENAVVSINGEPYKIKNIRFDGVDDCALSLAEISADFQDYGNTVSRMLRASAAQYGFVMPYNDVTVTITWGPVAGSAREQIGAVLTAAFDGYSRSRYTDDNWVLLVTAYNDGMAAITAAASDTAAEAAKDAAIAALAAVPIKTTVTVPISKYGSFDPGDKVGNVDVYVENTTFAGGNFKDTIVKKTGYALGENDIMMTVALRALKDEGFSWNGAAEGAEDYRIAYLASISRGGKKLGEFDGEQGSGWMGTLNDWFVNESLQAFSAANGKLANGDEVRIMFTQNLGVDLGGTWGNSDTSLKGLTVSPGALTPAFSSKMKEYALILSGSSDRVKVTPAAANKNYLVKTFLNQKITNNGESNSFYKRTESIPVRLGDVIYIGVGEYAWPSMNNQETEARNYTGTWYELHVISPGSGSGYVSGLIAKLPEESKITAASYESYRVSIVYARTIYNILSTSEQAKVSLTKLSKAEGKLAYFDQIQNVKNFLADIPKVSTITTANMKSIANQILAADGAYKALSPEQQKYITVGIVQNYNDAIEKLTELGAFRSGSRPDTIQGSEKAPAAGVTTMAPQATVSNGVAAVTVSSSQMTSAIEDAKKNDSAAIVIAPEISGNAGKVSVELPKSTLDSVAKETDADLTVETPAGSLTIPNSASPL